MTVEEIEEHLSYPTPHNLVQKTVWEQLLGNGTILRQKPTGSETLRRAEFIREYNAFGKASFRRVLKEETVSGTPQEYVPCRFGEYTLQELQVLLKKAGVADKDAAYVLGLPWEKGTLYHKKDDRICRILRKLADVPD